jgi:hypothetical protein
LTSAVLLLFVRESRTASDGKQQPFEAEATS